MLVCVGDLASLLPTYDCIMCLGADLQLAGRAGGKGEGVRKMKEERVRVVVRGKVEGPQPRVYSIASLIAAAGQPEQILNGLPPPAPPDPHVRAHPRVSP